MTLREPRQRGLVRGGRFAEALPLAERAVAGALECLPGHAVLASILVKLGRMHEADRVVLEAMHLATGPAEAYDGLAYVALELAQHERANQLYQRATELSPDTPRHWYNLACSERSLGRLAEAEAACERCLALDPAHHATYLLRSELRVQAPVANHIDELRSRLARIAGDDHARAYVGYALAKELDDVGCCDEAFVEFTAAAQARRSQITYEVTRDEDTLRRIAQVFARDASAARRDGAQFVFIVGLPRSGTTLVERILSALAGVRSNGETHNIARALTLAAHGPGDMFQRAGAADPAAVAAHYARLARADAAPGWIIDKLPTNSLYLGAIHRALPGAKLLLVSRSPLDSCFAMFRTLFGDAYPFTYDFAELARYYAAHENLMRHWRRVLGGAIHDIAYEELVREPRAVGAAMARHCGLTWSDAAADIRDNHAVSLTASASQIRRPIYGSSSGRWRRYHRHLGPLIRALRDAGVSLPDDA